MYEPNAFNRIRNLVSGKTVTLLGSAPGNYSVDLFPENQPLVCINAAALGMVGQKERVPEITIINTAVAGSPNAGKPTRELLNRMDTKLLVIVESGFPLCKAQEVFEPITRDETALITIDERCKFLEEFLEKPLTGRSGGKHVPSTGFFSLLALLACNSKKVIPFGLSFREGHSYLDQKYKREHIERDCEVLNFILNKSLPVEFSTELISAAKTLAGC
jgi:hypothetical protein